MIARVKDGQRVIHRSPSLEPPLEPERRDPTWPTILLHCFGTMIAAMFGAAIVIGIAFLAAGNVR